MASEDNVLFILDHQRLARENRLRVNAQGTLCVPIHDKSQALGPDYWITILVRNLSTHEWDPLWDKRLATEPPTGIYRKDDLSPPTFHPETFANLQRAATTIRTDENEPYTYFEQLEKRRIYDQGWFGSKQNLPIVPLFYCAHCLQPQP